MYIRLGAREMYNKRSALIVQRYPNTMFFFFSFFFTVITIKLIRFAMRDFLFSENALVTDVYIHNVACIILFTRS